MSKMRDIKKYNKDRSDSAIIPRGAFSADTAKVYILISILAFHILPLVLALMKQTSNAYLNSVFMFYFDPIIIFALLLVYGIKIGFNAKMPLLTTALAAISTIMYYHSGTDAEMGILYYPLLTLVLALLAYGVTAFLGILAGSLIRHFRIF